MNFSSLPTELLLDILRFLNRNECERNQIVSSKFNQIIKNYDDILPLRLLKEINAKNHTFKYALMEEQRPNFNWSLPKDFRIEMEENMNILADENDSSLKACVIEAFVMVCNIPIGEEQWNIEEIFKRLASIRSLIGRPLLVKNFFFKSPDDNITRYVLSHLENLFGELLHVETAHLGFYQHILRDIMDNPSLIELSSLPYIVNIRCGYCWSEESYYRADMLISFLTKMKFFDREYTFKLCYAEDEFKQKFERNFKKEMLPRLPKKFHLNVWPNGGNDEITIEI